MLRHKENDIEWLEYELLAECKGIEHRVFLRHGGHSEGNYASLNFSTTMGDNPQHVAANYAKAQQLMNTSPFVIANQQHGKSMMYMNQGNRAHLYDCDGLMTNARNLPLMIRHADCQAACFYDPVKQAVAMVHCGWRGNVQNIYAETIGNMKSLFGSCASNILVCISPSLGPERSEFINYKTELPESFWQFQPQPLYFDLWEISQWQLTTAGILAHHIQIAKESTWANPEDYFSYRRSHQIGNHGSVALLKH